MITRTLHSNSKPTKATVLILYFTLCVCFACLHVCALCVCLMPAEAREGAKFPGTEVTILSCHVGPSPRIIKVLLTTESSLHPIIFHTIS